LVLPTTSHACPLLFEGAVVHLVRQQDAVGASNDAVECALLIGAFNLASPASAGPAGRQQRYPLGQTGKQPSLRPPLVNRMKFFKEAMR
jgi:hypothetical protein